MIETKATMKKRGLWRTALFTTGMIFGLVGCGISQTYPRDDAAWGNLGFSNGFRAPVDGKLVEETIEQDGISLKWTDSKEASLDRTITWLQEEGFDTYQGEVASKASELDGAVLTYSAIKSVTLSSDSSAEQEMETKTVLTEVVFVVSDVNRSGENVLANEFYFSVSVKEYLPFNLPSSVHVTFRSYDDAIHDIYKVGQAYYYTFDDSGHVLEEYYHPVPSGWMKYYQLNDGGWEPRPIAESEAEIMEDVFAYMNMYTYTISDLTPGQTTTIAGVSVVEYRYRSIDLWYDPITKLNFKVEMEFTGGHLWGFETSRWDTTISDFGDIELPA